MTLPVTSEILSPGQARFVKEMVADSTSPTKAARRAGYNGPNVSNYASELMAKPKVRNAIEMGKVALADKFGLTPERVLKELGLIAFASPGDVIRIDENGEAILTAPEEVLRKSGEVIFAESTSRKGGKVKTVTYKTVKTADKIAALSQIGKHFGMFKETIEVNAKMTLEQLVEASFGAITSNPHPVLDVEHKVLLPETEPSSGEYTTS